jgi:hypothetical protein
MAGGHGKVPVSIRMTDLSTGQVFGEFGGITDFKDPVEPAQMAVCMALRFPQAGLYALELNINKTLIATHRLIVEAPPVISYTN